MDRSSDPPSRESRERRRRVAFASARTRRLGRPCSTESDDGLDPVRGLCPQGDVREHVEPEQQTELYLDGQERGKLEQPRIPNSFAEKDEASRGEGESAGLGDRGAGTPYVRFVEFERSAQLDDGGGRVPD